MNNQKKIDKKKKLLIEKIFDMIRLNYGDHWKCHLIKKRFYYVDKIIIAHIKSAKLISIWDVDQIFVAKMKCPFFLLINNEDLI